MKHLVTAALGALLAIGVTGCQPGMSPDDVDAMKKQLAEIQADVKEIKESQKRLAGAQPARRQRPPEDFNRIYTIEVGDAPIKGRSEAPIALVEYSDFQCPFCSRVQPNLQALLDKYPDDVKLVYKHFPLSFHREARPAALASMAAQEQGKFWEMHDVLFENQKALSADKLEEYAKQAGLDLERFKQDMEKNRAKYEKRVQADMLEGQRVDVRGTPSLYIGGKKVRDRSIEAMSALVEEALKREKG